MVSKARQLAQSASAPDGRKNLIINGGFEVSQRGTSFTTDNIYTLDRWSSSDGSGGSPARTTTQETFSLGQTDVPKATHFLKHNQTAASTNGNAALNQRIEDVTRFDNVTVTLSFYAKADAALTIDVQLIQNFGSGGSPSSNVTVSETGISVGTSFQKYTVTKDLASLSGKTLGTDGRHTSYLQVQFDFDDTSTFTFEVAQVQLEFGSVATEFEQRSFGEELALCLRYFIRFPSFSDASTTLYYNVGMIHSSTKSFHNINLPVPMRTQPDLSISGTDDFVTVDSGTVRNLTNLTILGDDFIDNQVVTLQGTATFPNEDRPAALRGDGTSGGHFALDAEL